MENSKKITKKDFLWFFFILIAYFGAKYFKNYAQTADNERLEQSRQDELDLKKLDEENALLRARVVNILFEITLEQAEQARLEAEKARLETEKAELKAEKARLEAEKARLQEELAQATP